MDHSLFKKGKGLLEDDLRPGYRLEIATAAYIKKSRKLYHQHPFWQSCETILVCPDMQMPKVITPHQKQRRVVYSRELLNLYSENRRDILGQVNIGDENGISYCDPESKQDSKQRYLSQTSYRFLSQVEFRGYNFLENTKNLINYVNRLRGNEKLQSRSSSCSSSLGNRFTSYLNQSFQPVWPPRFLRAPRQVFPLISPPKCLSSTCTKLLLIT